MFRNIRPEFTRRDYEIALIKLAFLKENTKFQDFFLNLKMDPSSLCPQFRKPEESDLEYIMKISRISCNPPNVLYSDLRHFHINYKFVSLIQEDGSISTQEILDMLDPQKEIEYLPNNKLIASLPLFFYSQGVYGFRPSRGSVDKSILNNYERLVKIDLRKSKSRLVEEFKQYVEQELILRVKRSQIQLGHSHLNPDFIWNVEDHRNRKETLKQIEVWRFRKVQVRQGRLSFKEIAKRQNKSLDTVKKRFYRAYEQIYGKPYNSDTFQKLVKKVRIDEIEKNCQNCTDRKCKDDMANQKTWTPCPDVLPYIDQDKIRLKESYLREDSDSYIGFLQSK